MEITVEQSTATPIREPRPTFGNESGRHQLLEMTTFKLLSLTRQTLKSLDHYRF